MIDQILRKYYSDELIESNKNYEFAFYIAPDDRRVMGSYLVRLRDKFRSDNDHKAFKEIIEILGGKITSDFSFINSFGVRFENDHLDKENLNKIFMIKYFQSNNIGKLC